MAEKVDGQGHPQLDSHDKTLELLFQPYRRYASLTRDADAVGMNRQLFAKYIIRSASILKNISFKMIGNFFEEIKGKLNSTHDAVLFVVKFRFDETPSKISVEDLNSSTIPNPVQQSKKKKSSKARPQLCKLLQTELQIAVLLNAKTSADEAMLVTTTVPTPLQVVDRTTGRNIKAALEKSMSIPGLAAFADSFPFKTFLFNADEYSANDLAQFGMQNSRKDWMRMSTLCDVHKASTCQGRVFELSGPSISAIINLGLSMTPAGSLGKLQGYLVEILRSRFQFRVGSPPYRPEAVSHKAAVLDLYFSIPTNYEMGVASSVSGRQRLRFKQKQRQRAIIEHFLNDDFRDHTQIVHWCKPGQYRDEEEALQIFLEYIVPALLPCCLPLFPRSRWFGADIALDWVGILASIHGLLIPLMAAWTGRSPSPAQPAEETLELEDYGWGALDSAQAPELEGNHAETDEVQPESFQQLENSAAAPIADADDGAAAAAADADGGADDGAFDWHKYQQRLKTSIGDWIFGHQCGPSPESMVAIMRQSMAPILKMLTSLMYISSQKFSKDQYVSSSRSGRRKYRMLQAFLNEDACSLLNACLGLLRSPPVALAEVDWRQDVNVLVFTMVSRLLCTSYQLLYWRRSKYPYKLFSCLESVPAARQVFQEPACLKDEWTQHLCRRFPSEEEFCSTQCTTLIESLAVLCDTDIAPIERQHTISRRAVFARAALGSSVVLKALSADWLLRQNAQTKANLRSYCYFDTESCRSKLHKKKQSMMKVKKQKKRKKKEVGEELSEHMCQQL